MKRASTKGNPFVDAKGSQSRNSAGQDKAGEAEDEDPRRVRCSKGTGPGCRKIIRHREH